jgi:hypothetical protein
VCRSDGWDVFGKRHISYLCQISSSHCSVVHPAAVIWRGHVRDLYKDITKMNEEAFFDEYKELGVKRGNK